jgi:hypothetical protein
MLTDFRAVLTLALRAIPDINISLWLPDGALREEVIVDYRKAPVVPDGYFVVERQGKKAHCFIEADQSTMSGRRFARKLKAYLGWWREGKSCDGQVKTDIELSHPAQPLEVIGTDIPQIRVQSLAVVEHLDVLDHVIPRFLPRGIVPQGRTLPLYTPEEPLGHCIV